MKRFAAFVLSMAMAVSSLSAMVMAEGNDVDVPSTEISEGSGEDPAEDTDEISYSGDEADMYNDGDSGSLSSITFTDRDWDPDQKKVISKDKTVTNFVVLGSSTGNVQTDAQYLVVKENTTIDGKLIIKSSYADHADVSLIVFDGVTLTCNKGIVCEKNNVLRIYGVSPEVDKEGKIVANGNGGAGIGGESGISGYNAGTIKIYGCDITATGSEHCAGIGGGNDHTVGILSIYDGYVHANGGEGAAGIGGGYSGNGGDIIIYGGVIHANGGDCGAGIGGGNGGNGGNITIRGAEDITAQSGDYGAGIGGGNYADGGVITINGGTVNADGGDYGAGIGGGYKGNGGTITINGGTVKATGEDGAGIGSGESASSGTIMITGGSVNASSSGWSAAIGAGSYCSFKGTIEISGGTVEATARIVDGYGYAHGASIGSGAEKDFDGTISFSGGNTTCMIIDDEGYSWDGIFCGPGTDQDNKPGDFDGNIVLGDVRVGISKENYTIYAAANQRTDYFKTVADKLYIDNCGHKFSKDIGSYSTDPSHPGQHKRSCCNCTYTDYEDHSLGNPSWKWNGFDSADLTLTCDKCGDTVTAIAAGDDITSKVTKESTYVTNGERVYTAAVTVAGKEYTGTTKEVLPLRTDTYEIKYKDIDGNIKTAAAREFCGDEKTLETGWYAVTDSIADRNRITCNGDVNIILCDGAELKAPQGFTVSPSSVFTVWGQDRDSGKLTVICKNLGDEINNAAIGGTNNMDSGLITINGGTVVAEANGNGSAIGGGSHAQGTVVINGGRVTASCGKYNNPAAIGGGVGSNGDVTINGGVVTATNNGGAAAIGGGFHGQGIVVISGGVVNASNGNKQGYQGLGIGNGWNPDGYSDEQTGSVILNYGDDGVSITSTGYYGADVTLYRPFTDGTQNYAAGPISDATTLENKTLRPPELVAGYTVSLDGTIGVNYHMDLTSEIAGHLNTAYMSFTVGDSAPQKVYLKDAKTKDIGGKTYYVFRCEVPAKDMTTSISAKLVDGDAVIPVNPFTVKDYADYLLDPANAHPDYNKAKDLVIALLNYGYYSQDYFGVDPGSPANKEYEYSETDMAVTIPDTYKDYDKVFPDLFGTFEGTSLSLRSETTLSFYFKSSETLSFYCDDETKTVDTVRSGGYQIARIRGIKASELGRMIRLDIKINGAGGYYIVYRPLTYCYKVMNGGSNDVKLQSVCKALYKYYMAMEAYNA